jgi:tetratricopeptide (TPR) repeat protein
MVQHRFRAALPLLEEATRLEPQNLWAWFDLGLCQEGLGQDAAAAASFSTCIALEPRFAPLYWKRGVAWHRQQLFARAEADLGQALDLQPGWTEVLVDRGLTRRSLKRYPEALDDLDQALRQGAAPVRVLLIQAQVRKDAGDTVSAQRDFEAALARAKEEPPTDERSWLALGDAWIERGQNAEAQTSFHQALKRNPRSLAALQNLAYLLAQDLAQTEEASKVLDQLLSYYPDNLLARANRGVLLARLGRRDEARADAQYCELPDSPAPVQYRIGCTYALLAGEDAGDRGRAYTWLGRALRSGYGIEWIDRDPDLDAIRNEAGFARMRSLAQDFTHLGP